MALLLDLTILEFQRDKKTIVTLSHMGFEPMGRVVTPGGDLLDDLLDDLMAHLSWYHG